MNYTNKTQSLGEAPIGKLIFKMSLPAILSMLIQALYNIVDSMYVGTFVGDNGLNALSLVFPLQLLLIAASIGIGVGANSLISRKLGIERYEEANNAYKIALLMSVITSAIFIVLGTFLPRLFLSIYSKDTEIVNMGTSYLTIVMMLSLPMFIEMVSSKSIQATGNMILPMIAQLIGALINIVLDPIFINNLNLGIKGAAYATVIAQACAMLVPVISIFLKKTIFDFNFLNFKFNKNIFNGILAVGFPTMIMNSISSITTAIMNLVFTNMLLNDDAVTIYGIYFKLQSFVFMPIFGLTQGVMPILGFNYAANKKDRFLKAFKICLITSITIMTLGTILFELIPGTLMDIFHVSSGLRSMGIIALKRISPHFVIAACGISITTVFQAIGHGFKSMMMSLLRQIFFLIPSAILLGYFINIEALWFCFVIAEALNVMIFTPIVIKTIKKIFDKMNLSTQTLDTKID